MSHIVGLVGEGEEHRGRVKERSGFLGKSSLSLSGFALAFFFFLGREITALGLLSAEKLSPTGAVTKTQSEQ